MNKNHRERVGRLHPATNSLSERGSLRNMAPEKPVRIGIMNVSTVASDNDKYCKEIYIVVMPKNLRS